MTRCKSAPGGGNQRQKPQRSTSYLHVLTVDALESEHSAEETGNKDERTRCMSPTDEDTSLVPLRSRLDTRGSYVGKNTRSSCLKRREFWSLYIFSPENRFRKVMVKMHSHAWFDRIVLFFILFNCVVMALEEPDLDQNSKTGQFIHIMQYIFTAIFTIEMSIKVISLGLIVGPNTYLRSGWNIIDGVLVIFSLVDLIISLTTNTHSGILGVLRVFRAFRTLRPLRVINRAPGLKLVVETLLSSMKPIGNVVLIAATFFTIFGILGVQLFKGKFYSCHDATIEVKNKSECLLNAGKWLNNEYNFDHLARALLTLFVFATRDGWVTIMYSGVDAVGVDEQPQRDHSKWNVLYFVAFLLLAGFVVLNMLVGIVVENFHKCRNELLKEQKAERSAQNNEMNNDRSRSNSVSDIDYQSFPAWRQKVFLFVTHGYFDLAIAVVIAVNVLCMAMEHYNQPENLTLFLKYANYVFTIMFIIEAALKILALGFKNYFRNKWNCLDMMIVVLSIGGIILDELATSNLPMNPTIIRVMRVLRITRVLKLLKTAEGIRSLLDTVGKALPQVANLGMLFLLLFFIFGALGMELFGNISCEKVECEGLDTHAHFRNFGYSVLTLFRVSTGDNWNGILKDTIDSKRCEAEKIEGCQIIQNVAPIYFASFVLITQFVLLNVVVAVMMKHLEESKFEETMKNNTPRTPRLFLGKRTPDTPRRSKSSLRLSKGSQQSLRSRRSESGILKKKRSLNADGGQRRAKSLDEIRNNNLRLSSGSEESDCCFEDTMVGKDYKESCSDLRQRKPSLETPVKENKDNEISEKCKISNSVMQIVEIDDCESSEAPEKTSEAPEKTSEAPAKSSRPVVKHSELRLAKSSESLVTSSESSVKASELRLSKSLEIADPLVKDSGQALKRSLPKTVKPNDTIDTSRTKGVAKNNFVRNKSGSNLNNETNKLDQGEKLQNSNEMGSKEEMRHSNKKIIKKNVQEQNEKEIQQMKEKNRESDTQQPEQSHDRQLKEDEEKISDLKETEENTIEQGDAKGNESGNDVFDSKNNEHKQLKKHVKNNARKKHVEVEENFNKTNKMEENLKRTNDVETPALKQNFNRNIQETELDPQEAEGSHGQDSPKEILGFNEGSQVNSMDNSNEKVETPEGVSKDTQQLEGNIRTHFHGIRLEPLPDNVTKLPPPASNA